MSNHDQTQEGKCSRPVYPSDWVWPSVYRLHHDGVPSVQQQQRQSVCPRHIAQQQQQQQQM
jgi:hypothetical protein